MIERLIVFILLLIAFVTWLFGSILFWIPLVLGIILGAFFYRIENKRFRMKDNNDYYIVKDVKLNGKR